MDLETELAAVENQIERALGTQVRRMECHSLPSDSWRVCEQIQLAHQLIALQLILPPERIRIRTLLYLVVFERVRGEAGPRCGTSLVNDSPRGGGKDLPLAGAGER